MHPLLEKIDAIELKSRQLIHRMDGLKRENDLLVEENNRIKKELNQYIDKIEGLSRAIDKDKSNSDINKQEFKRKIERYVREIDECIKLLNA